MKQINPVINIPNILTVIRILLTPVFVTCLLHNMFVCAFFVFTIAGITDGLDGLLARYFNQHTTLGAYLDPIADKLLLTAAFICLAIQKSIPAWLAIIVISRDIFILLGIAFLTIIRINIEIKPAMISKLTTVIQLGTIFIVLFNLQIKGEDLIRWSFYWLTAGLTVLSGSYYTFTGFKTLQNALGNNRIKRYRSPPE